MSLDRALEDAIREAKVEAGLDPNKLYQPKEFVEHLDPEFLKEFWKWQVDRYLKSVGVG